MERKSSLERKKEILNTALQIIYQDGYQRLTVRNIADKIGISEAAIYRHFTSKEEIISKLADKICSQNQFWNQGSTTENPIELLNKIMHNQVKVLKDNPYLTAIIFQEEIFSEYPEIKKKLNTNRQRNEEIIKNLVIEGIEERLIAQDIDPSVFAILYMGSLRISVLKWRNSNFNYQLEKEIKKLLKELNKYLQR